MHSPAELAALGAVLMALGDSIHGAPMDASVDTHWVSTWAAAQQLTEPENLPPLPGLRGSTLRQVVRITLGGTALRVRFSNEYGAGDVVLVSAHCALSAGGHAIDPATDRVLPFGGKPSVTLRAGHTATSDPINFEAAPLSRLAVTVRFGEVSRAVTGHPGSRTTSYLQTGGRAAASGLPDSTPVDHWYILSGIDVLAEAHSRAVVVLGDSITDGRGSTTNENDRWPDILARRLWDDPSTAGVALVNAGVGGNAVVRGGLGPTAARRFDRDVLEQCGVRWVIVLEGVNDIGASSGPTVAEDLIRAYGEFIRKAHDRGLLIYGVPILPFGGSQYGSAEHETARQTVNAWIRTPGHFDAVIDLDAVVRDPANPSAVLRDYDTGDHLHLNPLGYRRMGEAVDLELFR